jgi:hypothetical protein
MSDEREVFERAARDMRPEFRARMQALLRAAEETPAADGEPAVIVEVTQGPSPIAARRRIAPWLASAAAVVVVLGGIVAVTRSPEQIDVQSPSSPLVTSPPPPGCEGTSLGTALTTASPIDVFALDGGSFCLERRGGRDVMIVATAAAAPTLDPDVVESGPVEGGSAWYYVFAVPERLPVDVVLDERQQLARTFLHPGARRLLIIESDVAASAPAVTRTWQAAASPGGPFATLTAQGPRPASASAPADGTMPPPAPTGEVTVTASPNGFRATSTSAGP